MDNEKTDVEKLPFGQSIGKLQVYKNGRVVLKVGFLLFFLNIYF